MGFDQIDIFDKKGVILVKDLMLYDFEVHYPSYARDVVDYWECCIYELAVKMYDGEVLIYDYINKAIRRAPSYGDELTEQECKNEFGLRLQRILYSKGMTQEDLADAIGISRTMVNHYITGRINPSFTKVDKICRALKCSMDELRYIPKED